MTEFDELSYDELKSLLQKNSDSQYDIKREIKLVNLAEEKSMQMIEKDRKAVEFLFDGWTGEAAEKYISESIDETDMFKKQLFHLYSQEQDRLLEERRRLENEEEEILRTITNKNNEGE